MSLNQLLMTRFNWHTTKSAFANIAAYYHRKSIYKLRSAGANYKGYKAIASIAHTDLLHVSKEVQTAVAEKKPVVALESTIITHGMPYPHNLNMSVKVESIIRKHGAIPATIALLDGKACVGLTDSQLVRLAEGKETAMKVSRRDMGYALSKKVLGGTTISGTMVLAHMAGIELFVSGGLGGVHRGGEVTMDVSADLTELGRTPVAVITSGVKSILDIGRTLEFLETQGVCVATYGSSTDFPAFFAARSGYKSPYNVHNVDEAANLLQANFDLNIKSATLIAVPIPEAHQMSGDIIEDAIQTAILQAEKNHIKGKYFTPYILQQVNELTEGKSLAANLALVENNARVGAQIACKLSALQKSSSSTVEKKHSSTPRPVVIGASIFDSLTQILDDNVKLDGATYRSRTVNCYGGVGRNLADVLARLGSQPHFLTALGTDENGDRIVAAGNHMDWRKVHRTGDNPTATYNVILNKKGEAMLGIAGDMSIHDRISPDYIDKNADLIKKATIVCMDGNLTISAIEKIGTICQDNNIPVFFEPTDTHKACRPFQAGVAKCIHFIKPNMNEFNVILKFLRGSGSYNLTSKSLIDVVKACNIIMESIPNVIISLGSEGALLCMRKHENLLKLPTKSLANTIQETSESLALHYEALPVANITSSSGAGDCFGAVFINGYLKGFTVDQCMRAGIRAAKISLQSNSTVPEGIIPHIYNDESNLRNEELQ